MPTISVVTPTFRMAKFLPLAVESVLSQARGDVEYIVADGGSDDGTVELLTKSEGRLRWSSRRDNGAADALATAFEDAKGRFLGWLNADDMLLPGALTAALDAFSANPEAVAVFSGAIWIDEAGQPIRPYPVAMDAHAQLSRECLICQPACYFRADAYRAAGGINRTLTSAFDYDLWIRLSRLGPMIGVPGSWALSRMHANNKSLGQRDTMFTECMQVLARHYQYVPFQWVYCRRLYRMYGGDQFFTPLEPSLLAYLLSLPEGVYTNRRHPWRYLMDWGSQMSLSGLARVSGLQTRF